MRIAEPPGHFPCDEYSESDLKVFHAKAYRRFYMSPRRLFKKLLDWRLWKEIPGILGTLFFTRPLASSETC
ncbi:MAG: hypothetical protein M5R36_24610 [Deltaproteobacteria bacterium]|nr:hypothetical protein [Deltaproteobacteria bacterium]